VAYVARVGETMNTYIVLVVKSHWKRPLWIITRRCDIILKFILRNFVMENVNWIELTQNYVQWWTSIMMVMDFRSIQTHFLEYWHLDIICSRETLY